MSNSYQKRFAEAKAREENAKKVYDEAIEAYCEAREAVNKLRPFMELEKASEEVEFIVKGIVKENFSLKGERKPEWKLKKIKDDDGLDLNIFIDITSGLVVYNEKDIEAKTLKDGLPIVYGIWDSQNQEVVGLTKEAEKYAKKIGLHA